MKFAYDFSNSGTRGWVRGNFELYGLFPADRPEAVTALNVVARSWPNGTNLRLVEIADDGTETFPPATAKGNRGEMPKDKNG